MALYWILSLIIHNNRQSPPNLDGALSAATNLAISSQSCSPTPHVHLVLPARHGHGEVASFLISSSEKNIWSLCCIKQRLRSYWEWVWPTNTWWILILPRSPVYHLEVRRFLSGMQFESESSREGAVSSVNSSWGLERNPKAPFVAFKLGMFIHRDIRIYWAWASHVLAFVGLVPAKSFPSWAFPLLQRCFRQTWASFLERPCWQPQGQIYVP